MNRRNLRTTVMAVLAIGAWVMTQGAGQKGKTAVMQAGGAGCNATPLSLLDGTQGENAADKLAVDGSELASSTEKRGDPHGNPTGKCGAGQTKCKGLCTNTQSDFYNCGGCGVQCPVGRDCLNGDCVCPPGTLDCGGTCVNAQSDYYNCGACGVQCAAGQVCSNGICGCPSGQTDCNGTCIYTMANNANCGACGNVCGTGTTCIEGSCVVPPPCYPNAECGGVCVSFQFDNLNCGGCGIVCPFEPSTTCSGGVCVPVEPCWDCSAYAAAVLSIADAEIEQAGHGDRIVTGESAVVAGGTVSTWARVNEHGKVIWVGLTIPLSMAENMPEPGTGPAGAVAVLNYPAVVQQTTYFYHAEIQSNDHGHATNPAYAQPARYSAPHFDFHFYSIPVADVFAIPGGLFFTPAPAQRVPAGWAQPEPRSVPQMGRHAGPLSEFTATDIWTATMIAGFQPDASSMHFVEPMITRELLLGRANFTLPVPVPAVLGKATRYPSEFVAHYDKELDAYHFVFKGFESTQ